MNRKNVLIYLIFDAVETPPRETELVILHFWRTQARVGAICLNDRLRIFPERRTPNPTPRNPENVLQFPSGIDAYTFNIPANPLTPPPFIRFH